MQITNKSEEESQRQIANAYRVGWIKSDSLSDRMNRIR